MTTELEQEFFNVFGIEPIMLCDCEFKNLYDYRIEYGQDVCIHTESKAKNPCLKCKLAKQTHPLYPEITDRVLLELICILGNGGDGDKNLNLYTANEDEWFAVLKDKNNLAYCAAIDKDFKKAILKLCIYRADIEDFKQQIQSLFREGKNENNI